MKIAAMKRLLFVAILAIVFISSTTAKSLTGDRVLVLLDDIAEKDNYSQLWQSLQERQFQLTYTNLEPNDDIRLIRYGQPVFDHVIHFATESKHIANHAGVGNRALVQFVNNGGNLLVAATSKVSNSVLDLASEFDVELHPAGSQVYDHSAADEKDIITTNHVSAPASIVGSSEVDAPILYRGIGLDVGKTPLINRVLESESTAFSASEYTKNADTENVVLAAALQARNSARATFVGSKDIFSDTFFDTPVTKGTTNGRSGNKVFADAVTKWTFQEKSVLKVVGHSFHLANETAQLESYRIKDDIVYELDVAEYVDDHWVPFDANDIQLEIIMLDPYIRTTLKKEPLYSEHSSRYVSQVRLPDVYGVFTFKVNYKRPGLTYLLVQDVVTLRHFRHNEYPRFLTAAYPYYASVGSMIVGFLAFCGVWLSTWDGTKSKKIRQD